MRIYPSTFRARGKEQTVEVSKENFNEQKFLETGSGNRPTASTQPIATIARVLQSVFSSGNNGTVAQKRSFHHVIFLRRNVFLKIDFLLFYVVFTEFGNK